LARKHGRRARQIAKSKAYQSIFQTKISSETSAADEWALTTGSEYLACGILSGITGNRAHGLIIDDPVKGRQDADSETVQQRTKDVYEEDLLTRLIPGGWVMIIQCVARGERVLTNKGWVPVELVQPGSMVWTHDDGKPALREVINTKEQGVDDIVKVIARSCEVRVNGNHPFLVVKGGLKKSIRKAGDFDKAHSWSLEWVKAKDLCEGDTVVTIKNTGGRTGPEHREMNFKGDKPMNHDLYWLLGFIYGDGWLIKSGDRGLVGFAVAVSIYDDLNNRVIKVIDREFGVTPKSTKYGYIRVDSKGVAKWLSSKGINGNAHTKRLPEWVYRLRPSDKRAFLRGFLDADGHLRESVTGSQDTWIVGLCNKDLLDDLRLLARTCGVKTTKIYSSTDLIHPPNSREAREFTSHRANFSFKQDRIELRQRYKGQGDFGRYFRFEDIESVISDGKEVVYDLEVEGSHNFIVEGFVTHNTRWNELDLSGGILPEDYEGASGLIHCRDGNDWYVVCLPAQCERNDDPLGRKPGEFLWPEWFSEEHFKPFMINTRTWNALFQQRPQPETGTFFQRDWFKRYNPNEKPVFLHIYGSSDYAVTDDDGDFTEHGVIGVDPDNNIWILDWWHGQTTADVWFESLLDLIALHQPFCWFGEAGVIKRAISPFLERRMIEREVYCRNEWLPSISDKPTRARGFQARASQGKVYIPAGETGDRIIDQCLRFPAGSHDDAVDVLSLFCRALDQAHPAIALCAKENKTSAQAHIEKITRTNKGGYEDACMREQVMQQELLGRHAQIIEGRPYSDVDGY
ncbi:MAG: LAGLIDADG family homing endonuclease, partial [Syntrophotalea acetylenica]|nr:LAGLIDADG family homing endonuclease [Syntrophotalea acetylenica]